MTLSLQAQQSNNWYFGSAAGFPNTGLRIDFTSGTPVVSTCYPLMTEEGSSSISDANGTPLFYTDGVRIWDASTNTTFGTGMLGGSSTTQSAIVMPKPGTTNQWLVFTNGETGTNGVNYYTVTGSPGSFTISAATNLVAGNTVGEGLFVIGSTKAGSSFWVIARDFGSSGQVRAWDVTNTGTVVTTPVTSTLSGPGFTQTSYTSKIGTIKSNTCQNKLAFTYLNTDVDLVDFNTTTGTVVANTARRITVASGGGNSGSYGIEFSPNDSYLYITNLAGSNLYRHDIAANTTALFGTVTGEAGQLQLAPDGKIYMARQNGFAAPSYLGVINNPGLAGATFTANGLLLTGVSCSGNTGFSYRGLPTFPKSLVVTNPIVSPGDGSYCVNTAIPLSFSFAGSVNTGTISWTATGGGQTFSPGGASSTSATPTVTFSTTGDKTVTVTFNDNCGRTYSQTMNFTILTPKVPAGSISCTNGAITLTATGAVAGDYPNYVWYDAASGGNVLGIGSPVTLNYGDNTNAPASVWVEVAGSTSVSSSGNNASIGMGSGGLTWAANMGTWSVTGINVLSDQLTLRSFIVKPYNACTNGTFNVEIRNGANVVVFLKTYTVPSCGSNYTVNVNVELPKGNNYRINLIPVSGITGWWGGTWAGGTNAGQITFPTAGGAGTFAIANMIYDYKNFSVTTTCSQRVQVNRSCTLPVVLTAFNGSREGERVYLSWVTAQEINNSYFEIQRSTDGIHFETIGRVSGNGNTLAEIHYNFTDNDAYSSVTYYRLIQYDTDGQASIGPVINVEGMDRKISIFPNPSHGSFTLSLPYSKNGWKIMVTDVLGKEILKKISEGENEFVVENEWSAGVYILQCVSENSIEIITLVKE